MKKCGSRRLSLQATASLREYLLVILVATVSCLETARGNNVMVCRSLDMGLGLSAEQHQICLNDQGGPKLLRAVAQAQGEHFPAVCQYWMSDERWNCSNISMPVFPKSFQSSTHWVHKLTRETAYAQALTSSLLLYRVVEDCSDGHIPGCSPCVSLSDPLPSNEEWESCNQNVGYGIEFTKKFLDTLWRKDQHEKQQRRGEYQPSISEQLVHLHNLEAGRRAVTQNQEKHCHCHGMTGSCHMKTCTRDLPGARRIGQILKKEYENAQEVEVVRERPNLPYELIKVDNKSTLSGNQSPFPDHTQLVYQKESPDYCSANSEYGATGISGRECEVKTDIFPGPTRLGLCDDVCCKAGYQPQMVNVKRVCSCIINQDCQQTCSYQQLKYYCN